MNGWNSSLYNNSDQKQEQAALAKRNSVVCNTYSMVVNWLARMVISYHKSDEKLLSWTEMSFRLPSP